MFRNVRTDCKGPNSGYRKGHGNTLWLFLGLSQPRPRDFTRQVAIAFTRQVAIAFDLWVS